MTRHAFPGRCLARTEGRINAGGTAHGAVCAGSSPAGGAQSTSVYAGHGTAKRPSIPRFIEVLVGAVWAQPVPSAAGAIGPRDTATAAWTVTQSAPGLGVRPLRHPVTRPDHYAD